MKSILIGALIMFSPLAPAAVEVTDTVAARLPSATTTADMEDINDDDISLAGSGTTFEAGMHLHSINGGSSFMGLGITKETKPWLVFGAKALLPMNYSKEYQTYLGQVFARFNFLTGEDQMGIEADATQGFFNAASGTSIFAMFGLAYVYKHEWTDRYNLSLNVGVDYGNRVQDDFLATQTSQMYNKIALVGGYNF
jgi:hypothetical protein